MNPTNRIFIFLLAFVFILGTGFTCQKKYPQPPPESEVSTENTDPSSENSNSASETTPTENGSSQKPVDKTDQ